MDLNFKGDTLAVDYIDRGTGETVVILQGWGTTAALYESVIRMLEGQFRVIVPNFPGFGASTEPSFAYDTADYADFFHIMPHAFFFFSFGSSIFLSCGFLHGR